MENQPLNKLSPRNDNNKSLFHTDSRIEENKWGAGANDDSNMREPDTQISSNGGF